MKLTHNDLKFYPANSLKVIDVTKAICEVVKRKSIFLEPFSEYSLKQFLQCPPEKQLSITDNLERYLSIISSTSGSSKPSLRVSLEEECEFLDMTNQKFNLYSKLGNYDYLAKGDVIEVYLSSGIQIYRNFEFFSQCSYDLLMLSTHEWHILYERAQLITNAIFKSVETAMEGHDPLISVSHIPIHTLRERHLSARKVFSIRVKHMAPLLSSNNHLPVGFIVTSTSQIIADGSEADKVSHL